MRHIDLMPASCRARVRARTSGRRWLSAYGAVAAVLAVSITLLRVGEATKSSELGRLTHELDLDAEYTTSVRAMRDDMERLLRSIRLQEELAWPVRVTDVLSVVAGSMPDTVALTNLTMTPQTARVKGPDGKDRQERRLVVELIGISATDVDVANLIAQLESHALFDDVTIDHARSRTVGSLEAREFGVTCTIETASRTLIAEADQS